MNKRDFKNLLSEALRRQDRKFEKLLKKGFESNNKRLIGEFNNFVAASIVPQFDRIYTELREIKDWVNDLSHSQDRVLNILEKHEDRLERIEARL